jgi:para-aminobenzoate synthetase/4-amino-4-deoxychorismate lyase
VPPDPSGPGRGAGETLRPDRPDPAQGVFETLLVSGGRVHLLELHLGRLSGSLDVLYGLGPPPGLEAEIVHRAAALGDGEHRLRVDVTPGDPVAMFEIVTSPLAPGRPRPVALTPVMVPGGVGSHKWRDRRLLDALGPDPVPLLTDDDGTVLEAAWGNVWMIDGDRLVTPPADGRILPGVTRARLLRLAPSLGLEVSEEPIALTDARSAPALFLTSALRLAVAAAVDAPPDEPVALTRIRDALAFFQGP